MNWTSNMQQSQMMQHPDTQNTADPDARAYRIRILKWFGGIQIGIGILCGILSLVGVVVYGINMSNPCNMYYSYDGYGYNRYHGYYRNSNCMHSTYSMLFGYNMTCLILSGWNLLTGIFPFFMTRKRRGSWRCLKITFMVCSIVGASVFMPTVIILGCFGAVASTYIASGLTALAALQALLALIEMVVAIVTASYCCCFSSFGTTGQPITVYFTTNQQEMIPGMSQTQIPNGQIQVPLYPPVTSAQAGRQPIGATAQQYLVPGTHNNVMYQVPAIQNPAQATNHQMQAEESHPLPEKE